MQLIYDANNFLRRRFETGASVRLCYAEVSANPGIIVFDGKGGLKRRRAKYPAYKQRRKLPADAMFKQFDLFEETLQWADVSYMRVPEWEADDVIATLAKTTNDDIFIKSTDVDFLQLERVTIDRTKPPPTPPNRIRLYKATVGDQSDNIPGFKAFGEKSWKTLSEDDKDLLEAFLKAEDSLLPENLPVATRNWLDEEENTKLVRVFWDIIGFYDVPMEEIVASTKFGKKNADAFEVQLSRFML